mmetsp:Transcript_13114/g.24152  ORF Transcript_13114/g.24152 Transcript_13114/m.24152 type:complete len:505 (+) Transcript_13114:32-1546(+)
MAAVALSAASLPNVQLSKPTYDRSKVSVGIVHLGVGAFHRAHQARFAEEILASSTDGALSWGICGVSLMPMDAPLRDAMRQQDCLYTLWERGTNEERARILGCHSNFLFAPDDHAQVVEVLSAPQTKVVTLTVTEKGYCSNLATGALDTSLEAVQKDIVALQNGSTQLTTALGFLVEAARRRKASGAPPLAVLSCDNVQSNGDKLSRCVLELAEKACGAETKDMILASFKFPNSMVDRITPATTAAAKAELQEKFNINDACPVICEDYIQWVVEDSFPSGRPAWESVLGGACLMVKDVLPYELMKLRLLNGTHQAVGFLGILAGHRLVHEAMLDEAVFGFIERYMDAVTPAVPDVPGVDLSAYKVKLRSRFANQNVKDQLLRLTEDARNRIQVACFPCLSSMSDVLPLATLVACWIRYLAEPTDVKGQPFQPSKDTYFDALQPLADHCWSKVLDASSVSAFVRAAFGQDAASLDRFDELVAGIVKQLTKSKEAGMSALLAPESA